MRRQSFNYHFSFKSNGLEMTAHITAYSPSQARDLLRAQYEGVTDINDISNHKLDFLHGKFQQQHTSSYRQRCENALRGDESN